MNITKYKEFIREFPYLNQSFDIKKQNWKIESQQQKIDQIFNESEIITLNRFDLFNSKFDLENFIFKTLMWGYPTKGRGKNIENMLEVKNLEHLINILENYRDSEISIKQLKDDLKSLPGLGLSTLTKFAYFLNSTINGNKAVIFDIQIIEAINTGRFEEFNHLKGITYGNAPKRYPEFLKTINELSKSINAEPDQIEMFLFTFGRRLSEVIGEECYD
ncbi:hypothetical protein [Formosa sp. PL04]|uniref:8-oxoguanine DNA glycosylase OGG fold protein n=1 Tax=Formosa sp. PL04 TaxID=3081755 RepID=UPI002981F482|nr:hypothetical protein [Formosa sp. PL04]MDW5288749.1 hypothetical protein [Formosa sp. PL04]